MDPQLITVLGFVAAMIVLMSLGIAVVVAFQTYPRKQMKLHEKIASAQDGAVYKGAVNSRVQFKKSGVTFVVTAKHLKGKPVLKIVTEWTDPTFRAKFFPETISDAMKTFLGMQDVKIGNDKFDERFVIQSNDIKRLVGFLTPEVQDAIYILGDKAVLNFSGGKVILERPLRNLSDALAANNIVSRFATSFLVMHTATTDVGTSMTVTAVSLNSQAALCMVCGEQIVDREVYCKSCDTPHHNDCWAYLGQCSTYGCGSKKAKTIGSKSKFKIG